MALELIDRPWHISRWDAHSGRLLGRVPLDPTRDFFAAAFSHDGQWLASRTKQGGVTLYDAATGRLHGELDPTVDSVNYVTFSPEGRYLLEHLSGAKISLRDLTNGRVTPAPWDGLTSAIWTSSGEVIAVQSTGQLFRLDPRTGRTRTLSKKQPHRMWWPTISPDGRTMAWADADSRTVQLWSTETLELINDLPISLDKNLPTFDSDGIRILEFTPDGKTLASAGADRRVKLWDVATGQELLTLEGTPGTIWVLRFSPDGRVLAAVSSRSVTDDPQVFLWRTVEDVMAQRRPGKRQSINPAS